MKSGGCTARMGANLHTSCFTHIMTSSEGLKRRCGGPLGLLRFHVPLMSCSCSLYPSTCYHSKCSIVLLAWFPKSTMWLNSKLETLVNINGHSLYAVNVYKTLPQMSTM